LTPDCFSDLMLDITFSYPYDNKIILSLHTPLLFSYLAQVHTGIILGLQNRLATVGSFFGETCTEIPTGCTVVPNVSKISVTYAQP
jgi:hypothetical protein